jgi:hypothetical protein
MASESAALGARPIDTEMELMALSFDATYYYQNRPDVLKAFLDSGAASAYEFALAHYNNFGWKEGANPNAVFNTKEYLAKYEDVAKAGVNPFTHYTTHGQAEGRAPNGTFPALAEFDAETYLALNPDLGIAGITTAAAAYDHFITYGYAENRPGAPNNGDSQLVRALDALKAAEEAYNDFQADLDPALDTDADGVVDISELEDNLLAAEQDLVTARGTATDRELRDALSSAQAAVNAIPGLAALIERYEAALAAKDAATEAALATQSEVDAASARYNTLNATTIANTLSIDIDGVITGDVQDGGGEPLIEVGADGKLKLASGVTEADNPGITALLSTINADLAADRAEQQATARANVAYDQLDLGNGAADGDTTEYDDLVTARDDLEDRQELIDAVADAQALIDQALALEANVDAARDALEALGFENVAVLDTNATGVDGESDLFVFVEDAATLSQDIINFDAEDTLIFGSGYSVVRLADGVDITTTSQGSSSALNLFMQQQGTDVVFYVETDEAQGNQTGGAPFGGETVTLVGVDINDISIDANGIVRYNDVAIA